MTLVLRNGRLPGDDEPVDVEISFTGGGEGLVSHVGYLSPDRLSRARQVVDLDERWVLPGLWDNHVHFTQWAQTTRRLDLSAATSAAQAAALVAARFESAQQGDPVIGYGFRDGLWPDTPNRALLDDAAGSVPVVLVSGDLHCCWLNSAALAQHGFGEHATGLLREDECFDVVAAVATVADDVTDTWADEAARAAASRGVVGIVDLEMSWNLDTWRRRIAAGTDVLRVEFGIYTNDLARAVALGLSSGAVVDGTRGLLRVGPYKVITDGSLNTRTAYCFDEYPGLEGSRGSRGLLTVPTEELIGHLRTATGAGIHVAVHAIGDHANTLALDAFERVGGVGSIEHAQLLTDTDIARFAKLGVTASVQPEHAMDDRDVADRYWAGRTGRAFVLASLLSAGVDLALGSDAPVAPLDPWVTMAAAVGRTRDGREAWHPEQSISRQAALAASARGRHVVAAGDVADLAVTEIDPFSASIDDLRSMPVAATMLAGRFTHSTL
ncbi:MAG: amidohydrolase [Cryobacterium sp.]|jgi:predicted amidohydrolase YtcJ|nr:amidohydrolase [Cryobacterium sp.]